MIRLRRTPARPAAPAQPARHFAFLDSFGTDMTPYGVAVAPADGAVFVTDTKTGAVRVFGPTGTPRSVLGRFDDGHKGTPGKLDYPTGVAVSATGAAVVVDPTYSKVQVFDAAAPHAVRSEFGLVSLAQPQGVGVAADGTVYVADPGTDLVKVFAPGGTSARGFFGGTGSGNGQFRAPGGVAVAADGTVCVADTGNNRVQFFTAGGQYVGQFGAAGNRPGEFRTPAGVAVSAAGTVFVADYGNHRVQAFTRAGEFVGAFGAAGTAGGRFHGPTGVAVTPAGVVYVADQGNGRVQRWFSPADWSAGTNDFRATATMAPAGWASTLGAEYTLRAGTTVAAPRVELSGDRSGPVVLTVEPGATVAAGGGVAVGAYAALVANGTVDGDADGSRGTVTGTGSVRGRLTLGDHGTLTPGADGPGALTAGAATLGGKVTYNWRLTDAAGPAGVGYATLRVAGQLDITAAAAEPIEVNLWTVGGPAANFDPSREYRWTLAAAAGGVVGFNPNKFRVNVKPTGVTGGFLNPAVGTFAVSSDGTDVVLTYRPPLGQRPWGVTAAPDETMNTPRPVNRSAPRAEVRVRGSSDVVLGAGPSKPVKRVRWEGWQAVPV